MNEFESLDPSFREIVFYSEAAGDWPHIGPVVETLMRDHDRRLSHLASDPADPGLAIEDPRVRTFQIGAGTIRTILFARMNCAHFVMTLPDLGQLWLKRSVHPVHYIYLFHSMNSTHAAYRKGAFDAFDTVLCVGPYQVNEIRRTEQVYKLRPKELIEHGSVKLDTVLAAVGERAATVARGDAREVLIAPSWGDCSLIERPVGMELIDVLIAAGYRTVVRLHPMTLRRKPDLVARIRSRYRDQPLFVLEEDMNALESWLRSDVMVSDWSGAATEYAFALGKPVIYIDTPQKTVNAEWQSIGVTPFEDAIRRDIGRIVDPSAVSSVPKAIEQALAQSAKSRETILTARDQWVFNVGSSIRVAAGYLASL